MLMCAVPDMAKVTHQHYDAFLCFILPYNDVSMCLNPSITLHLYVSSLPYNYISMCLEPSIKCHISVFELKPSIKCHISVFEAFYKMSYLCV